MARRNRSHESDAGGEGFGLGGLFKGLSDLVEKLGDLAEKGAELRREGTFGNADEGRGLKGVYGFTVRVGEGPDRSPKVQPFGNIKRNAKGEPTVVEEREPVVDLFDEPEHVLVIAEIPGVELKQVQVDVHGDVLTISARAKDRKYHKEVLLPRAFESSQLSTTMRNGLLEVRLDKNA